MISWEGSGRLLRYEVIKVKNGFVLDLKSIEYVCGGLSDALKEPYPGMSGEGLYVFADMESLNKFVESLIKE